MKYLSEGAASLGVWVGSSVNCAFWECFVGVRVCHYLVFCQAFCVPDRRGVLEMYN